MSFLMGLNDSHAQIRGQLLLLDPLPPINKVFSLVIQEERQRNVSSLTNSGGADSINGLAFAFGMTTLNDPPMTIIPPETIKIRRRKDRFALIVIFMDIPLIDVTSSMVILQDINRSNVLRMSP